MHPQPVTARRSVGLTIKGLQGAQVILNIAHGSELEQILLADLDAQALVGLDQDFVEAQGVNADEGAAGDLRSPTGDGEQGPDR
jgi:hypothetical protein